MPQPPTVVLKMGVEQNGRPTRIYEGMHDDWAGLSDAQWDDLKNLFPKYKRPFRKAKRKGGRPRASDRLAFDAILWSLRGGCLERMPTRFGYRRTVFRRLRSWFFVGPLESIWGAYLRSLPPEEVRRWRDILYEKKRRTFWQDSLVVLFKMHFDRLPR